MLRVKIRQLGVTIGTLSPGEKNCITDVQGVHIGHVTLQQQLENGEMACTGVTAILPHKGNLFREKVIAASHVINGFGKTTGLVQLEELGVLESPILLTNTLSVPDVTKGALQYMLAQNPEIGETTGTINIVVGECNDSYLNSIRLFHVKPEHAIQAIETATTEQAQEGAVGAGTGMVCFGYKGGIGTSSRIVTDESSSKAYTMGCLVLSNFGRREDFRYWQYGSEHTVEKAIDSTGANSTGVHGTGVDSTTEESTTADKTKDGSIMIVIATDAPLSDRQLKRVAKRTTIGLGRTGSHASHGSGDIAIAFSTARNIMHFADKGIEQREQVREDKYLMNLLFQATAEVTEEAILNSLTQASTTKGRKGRIVEGLPYDWLLPYSRVHEEEGSRG